MPRIDATKLKESYLAAGGTEDGWQAGKQDMIEAARRQQAVTETLAEANRPIDINDALRAMAREQEGATA